KRPEVRLFIKYWKKHRNVRGLAVTFDGPIKCRHCFNLFGNHIRLATQIIDTPKGKLMRFSHQLSAPNTRPRTPLKAPMLILFSEAGRKPLTRINSRPNRIGPKKLMLA